MDGYCFYHQKSTSGVAHDVCFMFQVKTLLYLLSICYSWSIENHVFRSQKDLKLMYLWASVALEIWMDKYFITKNQLVEWLVMLLYVSAKALLYSLSICYWSMEKHPQTHLLTVISSITNMAGHMLQSPKINL